MQWLDAMLFFIAFLCIVVDSKPILEYPVRLLLIVKKELYNLVFVSEGVIPQKQILSWTVLSYN